MIQSSAQADAGWRVVEDDCVDAMRAMGEASVDAVVCDPPYGLEFMGSHWDAPWDPLRASNYDVRCPRCGKGKVPPNPCNCGAPDFRDLRASKMRAFQAWSEGWARQALRVLKPGGHLLAFGGTRTYHRLTAGLEDAGLEIRDCLAWIYGSGFPKSLDVSKAIDKRRHDTDDVRGVCRRLRAAIDASTHTVTTIAAHFGLQSRMVEHWAARDTDSQPSLPTVAQWEQLRHLLQFGHEMDAEVVRLNRRKREPGEAWHKRSITSTLQEWHDQSNDALTSHDGLRRDDASTPEAAQWQGWGTALKPAFEPIVLARKPLIRTVADNVLQHGTGALNVDGCRIDPGDHVSGDGGWTGASRDRGWHRTPHLTGQPTRAHDRGRWPSNVAFDAVAAAMLDEQSGELTSGREAADGHRRNTDKFRTAYGSFKGTEREPGVLYGDSGGASRFFYCAKTSTAERNAGTADLPLQRKPARSSSDANPGSFRSPATKEARNVHPTVKPIDLMRWLIRLVTPPGGVVLDPFAGSGTTGCAAVVEGFQFLGIERNAEYAALAQARIGWWAAQPRGIAVAAALEAGRQRTLLEAGGQIKLFDQAA